MLLSESENETTFTIEETNVLLDGGENIGFIDLATKVRGEIHSSGLRHCATNGDLQSQTREWNMRIVGEDVSTEEKTYLKLSRMNRSSKQ